MRMIILTIWMSLTAEAVTKTDKILQRAEAVKAIIRAAHIAEVPKELLIAICMTESSLRPTLAPRMDGDSLSYGLCQVKLETALEMDKVYRHSHTASRERLSVPFINAFYAAKYLKYQLKRYNGNVRMAVDAYNKGHHVSSESQYVRKVLGHLNAK